MAHMDQANKTRLAALCKTALAKWPGVKWSLSVRHHSTIVLTIARGDIDFGKSDGAVNPYFIERDWTGEARAFLLAAKDALSTGNHDRSDAQVDHHDVGWYIDIQIGRWNKPYVLTTAPAAEPARAAAETHPPTLTIDEMHAATSSSACPVCGSTEDHTGLVCLRVPPAAAKGRFMPEPETTEPEPLATTRASSFLSPIELIGAEQHEADYLGACIDNLTEPVRRGQISIRDALERVVRAAYQHGFTAGARYATRGK
jgi:hypothetical protein